MKGTCPLKYPQRRHPDSKSTSDRPNVRMILTGQTITNIHVFLPNDIFLAEKKINTNIRPGLASLLDPET